MRYESMSNRKDVRQKCFDCKFQGDVEPHDEPHLLGTFEYLT